MDPTKNRGRSKLFACFKAVAADDDDQELASPPSSGDESRRRRKKKVLRDLSVALNAVFFKMSLLKKSRNENSKQDFRELRSKLSSKSKKLLKSMKKNFSYKSWEPDEIFRTNSNSSSSLFSSNSSRRATSSTPSSSSSSASSFPSRLGSERNIKRSVSLDLGQISPNVNRQKSMKRNNCGNKRGHEMCVFSFLVCLVALVFWGKVFAIVTCTSTWLFFGPAWQGHRSGKADLLVNDVVDSSEENKRRVSWRDYWRGIGLGYYS
ncbi:hypothetical protein CDL12_21130 [Handroanthus impetiginosus]|uniref:Uncharacterized protein n=1 Tax=Handroanthus impetiginosus TaxID=429701 RepID=A0A2G9GM35_9LAMI|nr:hypothetical protein CDL12_21130 [Handroanthus impetiginosus]